MTICILGRQPAIGLAELESLYGASAITPAGQTAALVDAEIDFARLGSSVKAAKHLTTLDTTEPKKVFDYCRKELPKHLRYIPEGKIKLGFSLHGITMSLKKLEAEALSTKKVIKKAGRSVRLVPNKELTLSSAQTYHNALTSPVGMEFVFVTDGNKTHLGQVTHVQDIDAYTERDRNRPKRDAFVGMLPPKLAQTIINLAAGSFIAAEEAVREAQPNATGAEPRKVYSDATHDAARSAPIVLDPFCGTGVILMEAALMGYGVYGTDLSEKMVRYTRDNMNWLADKQNLRVGTRYETADSRDHIWLQPIDVVACEGYLGQPLGGQSPSEEKIREIIHECNAIMRDFLANIAEQLTPGTRLCVAMPAWFAHGTTYHLPLLEQLSELGYRRIEFNHASHTDLIYRREDQTTGRELVVLTTLHG